MWGPTPTPACAGGVAAPRSSAEACAERANRVADVVELVVTHAREERQRNATSEPIGGDGERVGLPAVRLLVIRVHVERAPVHGACNAVLLERVDECVAV